MTSSKTPAAITAPSAATIFLLFWGVSAQAQEARDIVRDAINHWRGLSSYAELTMVIHRPDWERSMSMRAWTEGDKRSLVRVTEPRKDRGNGTLLDGNSMWTFSPKVNRVIKVPSSMMNQSWMGSDFSNKDISRADDIVDQYQHTLLSSNEIDGIVSYEIQSIPHEEAAVVWGKEVLVIRDDKVVAEQRFYDQDGVLVKKMESLEIGEMGGRMVAIRQRMGDVESPEEWTEISVGAVEYDVDLSDNVFTLSNLRNPRN
jgi:outer membrane lipoprotein-sorting protein